MIMSVWLIRITLVGQMLYMSQIMAAKLSAFDVLYNIAISFFDISYYLTFYFLSSAVLNVKPQSFTQFTYQALLF